MSNPDVSPVGFAATDHPHSPLERRRGVWWLLAGGLLVAGGLAGVVLFVWQVVAPGSDPTDDAVAGGQVAGLSAPPTPAAMFTVEAAGTYTVWIDTGGTINSSTRDAIVAAANCAATFSDGVTKSFRGAVQGSSVVAGDLATVGTFDAPAGPAAVVCRSERFGPRAVLDQLEKERRFFVTSGPPDSDWVPFVALFAGLPALILGAMALGRGWVGSLRRRRPS
ncbi:MAG: hypothetical protein KAY11_08475 [Ilumatobacteraceae bacterium]|nr:hypothetical protein [Ilumatobacteraceae bacterium]